MADKYTPERATSGKEWLRTWWKKVENNFTKIFGAVSKHIDGTADRHMADMIDYSDTETVKAKLDSTDTKLDSTDTKLDTKVDKVSGKSLIDSDVAVLLDTDGNGALEIYPDCGDPTMRGSTKVKIDSEGACVRVVTGETRIGYDGITVGHENSLDSHGDVTVYETVMGETSATFKTHKLSEKANSSDVLEKTNTTEFTPTADYLPATKKYVDNNKLSHIANGETTGTIKIGRTGSQRTDGPYSAIIGFSGHTSADALNSIAMCGGECLANNTVAMGYTVANGADQFVQGKYNVKDTENKYAHIIGNGTSDTARSNAHTVDWSGNAWFAGDIEGAKDGVIHKLSEKVDKVEGKSLVDENFANAISYYVPSGGTENPILNLGRITLSINKVITGSVDAMGSISAQNGDITTILPSDGEPVIHKLSEKVNASDVLTKTNVTEFTPTADYQPATKKYVDDAIKAAIEKYNTEAMALLGED